MERSSAPPRAALLVAGALFVCWLLTSTLLSGRAVAAASDATQIIAAGLAAVTSARQARTCANRRLGATWTLLSLACGLWAAGQSYWTWLAARGLAPFPSLADIGFLGFAVFAILALLIHPAEGGRSSLLQRAFDSVMTAGAVGLVSWQTTLGAVVAADEEHDVLARLLLVGYPVADVVLVVLAILLITRTSGDRTALNLVGLGITALAVADSAFTYWAATSAYDGGAADIGWVVAFLLLALAGTCRSGPPVAERPAHGLVAEPPRVSTSALVYVPVTAALGVVLAGTLAGSVLNQGEQLGVTLVVATLLARQYVTVRDNVRLAADLAAREAELRHQAFHDPLTGLANRALFRDRLEHALALHSRDLRPLSVVFLDLDDFKVVNDTLGHAAGDELLMRVAERLTGALRGGDTVARLGGDEFAVLLEDDGDHLHSVARITSGLDTPFTVNGHSVLIRASIGVCALQPEDSPSSADQLLAHSDNAMYTAKRAGKGRVVSEDLDRPVTADDPSPRADTAPVGASSSPV